ncbi:argininosuccinate lyase [Candidatus Peregrinibacteria bacterium]|nr:argininosuccinate lyase [Candidatus Peregrinibacteria bacterium]
MSKLWQKKGKSPHTLVGKYTVGDDYIFDQKLMPFDIQGTKAHIKGLQKIGIFTKSELKKLLKELTNLKSKVKKDEIKVSIDDEDCHTVIENYLTKKLGKLGQKIHTGRSRNDQVLTAIRLYMKSSLDEIKKLSTKLAKEFLKYAEKYQNIPLPGYTHTQQAMLSSIGHYFCGFTESLIDDISFLDKTYSHINKNPLGSAAGFGVPLALDREFTTKELGFESTQINSLYCQNSRGKFESVYTESLVQIMLTLGRFATDLLLFTSQEFNFFKVSDSLVTGSSIMPQKRNLDGMEILRGNTSVVIENHQLIQNLVKNLMSGYNRDLQLMKKPLFESTDMVIASLQIVSLHLKGITPNKKSIKEKITKEIFSADIATEIAKKNKIPFRIAYQQALKKTQKYKPDFQQNINSKISLGAPGNLNLSYYKKLLHSK